MALPRPPDRLSPPTVTTLPTGTDLHRLNSPTFAGNAFNPCRGAATRFAPIVDRRGACVPSLYAGSSLEAAVFETVFHDVPVVPGIQTVPLQHVQDRCHSVLRLTRPIRLARLRTPDLKRWGVARADLIGSLPPSYRHTARWAEALHHQFDDLDGLVWTSNQCDPDDATLLFGDRVQEETIGLVATTACSDPTLLAAIRAAGQRAGIILTL